MANTPAPHTRPISCLSAFPQTMSLLKTRLEGFGFQLREPGAEDGLSGPIVFVPVTGDLNLDEIATAIQQLRVKRASSGEASELTVIGVYAGRLRFKINEVYRSGMTALYSLPLEEELLINKVFELMPPEQRPPVTVSELSLDQLLRIHVVELERTKSLPFDIYLFLPMNNKALLYLERNSPIDERTLKKFRENPQYSLYIHRQDVKAYLDYGAQFIASGGPGSKEEGVQAAKQTARRLSAIMGGFFNDETLSEGEARMMLETLKSLIATLEDQSGAKKDLVYAVTQFASQQLTHYTHAQNVAAYSCLFGLAIGLGEPETLRMGGLLHDLGLSDLPSELIGRDASQMTDEELAKYKLHPGGGKYSIETRKLAVPLAAVEMVLYHHERPDGSGYPYGKKSAEIPLVAKICAFADEFDKLTSVRPGQRQLSPGGAMRRLAGLDGKDPHPVYEKDLHLPLVELFIGSVFPSEAKAGGAT